MGFVNKCQLIVPTIIPPEMVDDVLESWVPTPGRLDEAE